MRTIHFSIFFSLVVAMAAMAGPTQAADVPGNSSTKATIPVSPSFAEGIVDFAGDSDWYKINLTRGKDYALQAYGTYNVTVNLRDKNGMVLKSKNSGSGEILGLEFRANYTGNYFVEYKDRLTGEKSYPFRYRRIVTYDCKAGSSTGCTLAQGDNRKWLFTFAQDVDWMAVSLVKGRRYQIDLGAIGFFGVGLRIVNASGATLKVWDRSYEDDEGSHYVISNFVPTTTGKYFVVTQGGEQNDFEYRVLLTTN